MPTWCVAFISLCGVLFLIIFAFTARAIYRHLSVGLYSPSYSHSPLVTQPPPLGTATACAPPACGGLSDEKIAMAAPRCAKPHENCLCTICLDMIERSQSARTIATCGHVFHSSCVKAWLRRNNKCPNCQRVALLEETVKQLVDLHAKRLQTCHTVADRLHHSGSFARRTAQHSS